MGSYDKYAAPTLGFVEQVYKIKPAADGDGRTMAMLKNAKGDRAASLSFNVKQVAIPDAVEEHQRDWRRICDGDRAGDELSA